MRASIKNYLDGAQRRREENGEAGFSLIELIVVVVILGILAAIAIPIFSGIQDSARQSSVDAIAGNGAAQVAAQLAQGQAASVTNLSVTGKVEVLVVPKVSTDPITLANFCVTATEAGTGGKVGKSGPGC